MTRKLSNSKTAFLILAWVLLGLAGIGGLAFQSYTIGETGNPPKKWPSASHVKRSLAKPSILLFLHPECSCSLATLEEMNRLLPKLIHKSEVTIVLSSRAGIERALEKQKSLEEMFAKYGVRVAIDQSDLDANLFDVRTSGELLLYDENGDLKFMGGITPARAHTGDSIGRTAILSYFADKLALAGISTKAPIYGCSLKRKLIEKGSSP